jgi:hypothetical protein
MIKSGPLPPLPSGRPAEEDVERALSRFPSIFGELPDDEKQAREAEMKKVGLRAMDAAEDRVLDVLLPPARGFGFGAAGAVHYMPIAYWCVRRAHRAPISSSRARGSSPRCSSR